MSAVDASVFVAAGAHLVGDVSLGEECSIWYNAVLRADAAPIVVGRGTNIQDNVTVHVSAGFPCTLGAGVTIGHNAVVHGCTIGDNTLVGMGAIVMNGAHIGPNCIIGAGAVVTQGSNIPAGSLVMGLPARVRGALTEEQIAQNRATAVHYIKLARAARTAASS